MSSSSFPIYIYIFLLYIIFFPLETGIKIDIIDIVINNQLVR
jgi:hypothetical protein